MDRLGGDEPIAIDGMGGDHAPSVPVEAALRIAREGTRVWIVGPEPVLKRAIAEAGGPVPRTLAIAHASEVIHMAEPPSSAARRKRDSSISVAVRLVKDGAASSMVSAGNSGAVMAAGLIEGGRLAGVQRPALAAAAPTKREPVVILDLGANIDPTPTQMAQFAVMGCAYAKAVLGRSNPRVGLLTNGSEEMKGTDLTRETHEILGGLGLNYSGYCEGNDVFEGQLDVVVVDGYTGNVALKVVEGFMKAVRDLLETEIRKSLVTMVGTLFMRRLLPAARKRLDYEGAGGAPLLGLRHNCFVAHGASSVNALMNAVRSAQSLARTGLIPAIEAEIRSHRDVFSAQAQGADREPGAKTDPP